MKEEKHASRLSDEMSLASLTAALHNDTMNRVVASLGEGRLAGLRCFVLGVVVLWVAAWKLHGPQPVLVSDAHAVFPWAATLFLLSLGWWLAIRVGRLRIGPVADACGTVANFLIIAILTRHAFLLLITLEAILPFLSVAIGARYSRRWFKVGVAASLLVLIWSAPGGYWLSRPAYLVYAVALTVGLPLLIGRILSAMREISLQAIEARDAQNRFVGAMSHEMRTPLNVIINTIALIDKDDLQPQTRSLVEQAQASARTLSRRVDNVMFLTRENAGETPPTREPVCVEEILAGVRGIGAHAAGNAGVRFIARGPDSAPAFVGDAGRIEQVLINLVSNAIKYTPRGGRVELNLTVETSPDDGTAVLACTVSDTGIGIPDALKARIFDPFYQVSGGSSRSHDGVGLGLYIVRHVTRQLGGTLSVADNPGGGTVFTWSVAMRTVSPSATASSRLPLPELLRRHRESVRPLHCLVIDDHAANLQVLRRLLEGAGHRMTAESGGLAGIAALEDARFDLCLLDLHMPGVSGWDVLQAQRAMHTPIVIVSADAAPGIAERARECGAAGFLSKPIDAQRLLAVLAAVAAGQPVDHTDARSSSPLDELRQLDDAHGVGKLLAEVERGLRRGVAMLGQGVSVPPGDTAPLLHRIANEMGLLGLHRHAERIARIESEIRDGLALEERLGALDEMLLDALRWIERQPERSLPSIARIEAECSAT